MLTGSEIESTTKLSCTGRWISLGEAALASGIVIGYSVFRVLPNSVFLLVGMALISFRLREGSWKALGLGRPKSWLRTVLIALAAAAVQQALGQFIVDPLTHPFLRYSAGANPLEGAKAMRGVLGWLVVIWTYAAFGEELGYRRYLLNRVADLGEQSRWALALGLLWSSAMFGFGHWYQGPAGFASATASGLVFGAAYLLTGESLWVAIFAHGASDTLALIATIFG
jgi:membrane protease YdiL (CAAX protease family)